ncbi:MAG: AmmeMemoRadiSam system protein B [Chloroflexi bacterium]|nr:AmmeMemoRadiSam system protein B [Chloroflexota bacterium]
MSWFRTPTQTVSEAVRPPAVAGAFYPASPDHLRAQVEAYLAAAKLPPLSGEVRAVIAPHAGYIYSGPIAGYSFAALPSLQNRTIYLMGPAHYTPVYGVATCTHRAFETPLGQVPVAVETAEWLVERDSIFLFDDQAHAPEHSLEVELPFLQVREPTGWRIAPLLFGNVNPEKVAAALIDALGNDPDALIVVSSDLSHYHSYGQARRLDETFLQALVEGDAATVARGEACGRLPILTLMALAQQFGWRAHLLDYRNSGDTAGDRQRVVGYAAVAFTAT